MFCPMTWPTSKAKACEKASCLDRIMVDRDLSDKVLSPLHRSGQNIKIASLASLSYICNINDTAVREICTMPRGDPRVRLLQAEISYGLRAQ